MSSIECPRERSAMTPCIARDSDLALADDGVCVGCGITPADALADLGTRYPPALVALSLLSKPQNQSRELTRLVAEYVER